MERLVTTVLTVCLAYCHVYTNDICPLACTIIANSARRTVGHSTGETLWCTDWLSTVTDTVHSVHYITLHYKFFNVA